MHKIRKAVIPAAGLGTRVLPATKAMPKEMLPIVDKPAIQYIVEEAVAAGIEEILIITGRGKGIMEDHFDHAFELERNLETNPAKAQMLRAVPWHRQPGRHLLSAPERDKGPRPCHSEGKALHGGRAIRGIVRRRRHHGRRPRGRTAHPRLRRDRQALCGHQRGEPRGHPQIFLHEMHPHQR